MTTHRAMGDALIQSERFFLGRGSQLPLACEEGQERDPRQKQDVDVPAITPRRFRTAENARIAQEGQFSIRLDIQVSSAFIAGRRHRRWLGQCER